MNKISNILTIKNRLNGLKIAYPSNSIGQSNENVYSKEKSKALDKKNHLLTLAPYDQIQ